MSRLENELRQQIDATRNGTGQLRSQFTETSNARATAEAKSMPRNVLRKKCWHEQRASLQDKALADLRETFKALSADALKQTAPEFLRLAEQSFGKFQEIGQRRSGATAGSHQRLGRAAQAAVGNLPKTFAAKRDGAIVHARRGEKAAGNAGAIQASRSRRRRSSSGWC